MNKQDGGPAFPGSRSTADQGMTIRDYFAGQALAGLCANPRPTSVDGERSTSAKAYIMADAMLAERSK